MTLVLEGGYLEIPDSADLRTPQDEITIAFWTWRDFNDFTDGDQWTAWATGQVTAKRRSPPHATSAYSYGVNFEIVQQLDPPGPREEYARFDSVSGSAAAGARFNTNDGFHWPYQEWAFIVMRWRRGAAGVEAMNFRSYDPAGTLVSHESKMGVQTVPAIVYGNPPYDGYPLVIGARFTPGNQPIDQYRGQVAGLLIHDQWITDADVEDLRVATQPVIGNEPAAALPFAPSVDFWPFIGHGDGAVNSNDGSTVGAAYFTPGDDPPPPAGGLVFRGDGTPLTPFLATGSGLVELDPRRTLTT